MAMLSSGIFLVVAFQSPSTKAPGLFKAQRPQQPLMVMNGRFGFGKPPAPPQSSTEKFLSSKPNNQELFGACTAFSGVFTFVAKVLDDDLKESISGSIKPLAADVAQMKNDLAAVSASLSGIGTDVSSRKTSTAFVSNNVAALDVLLVAVLVIALVIKTEETKKMSKELTGFNKKKR